MRVGVEVGGTFTDLIAIDEGQVRVTKVPSVPARPDEGAMAALGDAAIDLAAVADLVHGSTVATNAILERKGANVAFLVTRGFRDILLLQRHNRRQIYDLFYKKPVPVVRRRNTFEIDERVAADGTVLRPLDEAAAARVLERPLAEGNFQSVAICLLNGYANPAHEQALADLVRRLIPALTVTCSSDVTREFREYERASTTTLAAYVQPVIDSYLNRLSDGLSAGGFDGRFSIMQSNGGRLPAAGMARNAITSLYSGPAAGVMGATRQARLSGYPDIITLDMGGTSTDVCLVSNGRPALASETEVDGLPIRTPVLDIVTVGAGGGSICWIDDGGMLRVGPESAGADPGPACYRRGGERPTVTDAHLVRGSIRAEAFLGGRMSVDAAASEASLTGLAAHFGMSLHDVADSAVRVADANIVRAIQLVSTERGRDPRDYTMVPFGGAGPLHAARVAEELGISSILIPPNAGVLSAFGLLAADFVHFETLTRRMALDDAAADQVRAVFADLQARGTERLRELGVSDAVSFSHVLDMRFVGQAFEVPVELDEAALAALTPASLLERFNEAHHRVFAFGEAGLHRAEVVSFRLGCAVAPGVVPGLESQPEGGAGTGTTRVYDQAAWRDCRLLDRQALAAAGPCAGPALIEDSTSTAYVPADWRAELDRHGNILMRRGEA